MLVARKVERVDELARELRRRHREAFAQAGQQAGQQPAALGRCRERGGDDRFGADRGEGVVVVAGGGREGQEAEQLVGQLALLLGGGARDVVVDVGP